MNKIPDASADPHAVLARLLPPDALQQTLLIVRNGLPVPRTDDPRDLEAGERARQERSAVAGVVALLPRTAAEGRLAAQFVAADAWAMDCLHLAGERQPETEAASKCRAQAIGMLLAALDADADADADRGTPGGPSATQRPPLPRPAPGRSAMAAGKWRLISNDEMKSQGKRHETVPRLTLVPARPVAESDSPGKGGKGRTD